VVPKCIRHIFAGVGQFELARDGKGRALNAEEIDYVVALIMGWIDDKLMKRRFNCVRKNI
jgi:hypothetical protein